ncbi:YggT family protein [uncultured Maritimibacter sp.]|jgi:YggT family protein|uniref:YggT family protein n=1 Tax=uncultured Maritimibacter sp. TaxID=991866 RepID=UPI000AB0C25A|nr:YggT family protein [uncultured Maritimibacter sp.]
MLSLLQILYAITSVVWFIVIVHIIMSWLINFQVLNLRQQFVAQVWYGLNRLVEPVYGPIRRMLPNMGGLDLSPIIVLLVLFAIRTVINNNMYHFY